MTNPWLRRIGHRRVTALAVALGGLLTALLPTAPASADATALRLRPDFKLPFTCDQQWLLTTYRGHAPDDKKIDFFQVGANTWNAAVRASAGGTVTEAFPNVGGLEINHGHGWFTIYLHMQKIRVKVGQKVRQGTILGRVGMVNTQVPHLHYEQLLDKNGDNDGETDEMEFPVLDGKEYRLNPDSRPFPTVKSGNVCGDDKDRTGILTFPTWGTDLAVRAEATTGSEQVATIPSPETVLVRCQKRGEKITVGGTTNDAWSYLPKYGGYLSNIFVRVRESWLEGVPECGGSGYGRT